MSNCEHIIPCIDTERHITDYVYCSADATSIVGGIGYCQPHATKNDRRERIVRLLP